MAVNNDTAQLADDAASLSTKLLALPDSVHHDRTTAEISTIADELDKLSSTLHALDNAIDADPTQYTDAFNEDLKEITVELKSVLEEISDCCESLRSADFNVWTVVWFFRRGRVARLLQHLEASKGTLLVMRAVLWHGKEYGTHRSDRLAEASPHIMHEDRVILESVVAQNREAILDLHTLVNTTSDPSDNLNTTRRLPRAGDHYRKLSEAIRIDILPVPDVLPPSARDKGNQVGGSVLAHSPDMVRRTFSKRGVRLGVHISILNLSAHEAPDSLTEKWIQQADKRRRAIHKDNYPFGHHHGEGLTTLPELSTILEADTSATSTSNPDGLPASTRSVGMQYAAPEPSRIMMQTPTKEIEVPPNTPVECGVSAKKNSEKIANKLRRVVSKLSMTNLRTPSKVYD